MEDNSKSRWKIKIEYSENINPKLEIKPWGIIVTIPKGMSENKAYEIIEKHSLWIKKKHTILLEAIEHSRKIKLTNRSKAEFKKLVNKLIEQATKDIIGINPCKITIRRMKSKWASCSPKGTITINESAKHLPDHLISYIIYHEICHLIEPKHNEKFWSHIKKYHPNYRDLEKELLAYEIKLGIHRT